MLFYVWGLKCVIGEYKVCMLNMSKTGSTLFFSSLREIRGCNIMEGFNFFVCIIFSPFSSLSPFHITRIRILQ